MKNTTTQYILRAAIYLLTVTLFFTAVNLLSRRNQIAVSGQGQAVVDLTGIDFEKDVIKLSSNSAAFYHNVFYSPEDFAAGDVTVDETRFTYGAMLTKYGTARLLLKLPAGRIYTISAKNASYAQRLFINGTEFPAIGTPGDSAAAVIPRTTRYTASFQPQTDTTEVIIQYANFVHADNGGLYPFTIGLTEQVIRMEQLNTFQVAVITTAQLTAAMFFFGVFLFFMKSRYYLWFSLLCTCIACRGLFIGNKLIMLLLPDLNWYHSIRLEYLFTIGAILFFSRYISGLYPGTANRLALRIMDAFCLIFIGIICFTDPLFFTKYIYRILIVVTIFFVYVLLSALWSIRFRHKKVVLQGMEQGMFLSGFVIYLLFTAYGIYANRFSIHLWGLDYSQVGLMVFLFINILTLILVFSRTEHDLYAARQNELMMRETNQMLEQMDRLKTDIMANISHELKTPLAVMSGYAQLSIRQIGSGSADDDTIANLRIISRESRRLAELASGLLHSTADASSWKREAVSIDDVFQDAKAICLPLLARHNNRLEIYTKDGLPPVLISRDMIHQVLLNLISNANRHTENGLISLHAKKAVSDKEDRFISVTITDNGRGISPELLPRVFERQVSGSSSTGVGLAICREIIRNHGGTITIDSSPGKGTQVVFTLPLLTERNEHDTDDITD